MEIQYEDDVNTKGAVAACNRWSKLTGKSEEEERFKNKESKALATIALGIEPEHQVHILDCTKASDAWEALQKIFESKSRARILQLKKQMLTIKLKPNETMNSYLARLKTCSDSLREVGYEFKDEDLAYTMLTGLPDEYDGIITTLANLDEEKFKSAEIKEVVRTRHVKRIGNAKSGERRSRKWYEERHGQVNNCLLIKSQ